MRKNGGDQSQLENLLNRYTRERVRQMGKLHEWEDHPLIVIYEQRQALFDMFKPVLAQLVRPDLTVREIVFLNAVCGRNARLLMESLRAEKSFLERGLPPGPRQ